MRKPGFPYAKTTTQISFAVTAKLISAFGFRYKDCTFPLLPIELRNFKPLVNLCGCTAWLVWDGPGQKPRRPVFSQRGSYVFRSTAYYSMLSLPFIASSLSVFRNRSVSPTLFRFTAFEGFLLLFFIYIQSGDSIFLGNTDMCSRQWR